MRREEAVEAGARALVRWLGDGYGYDDMTPEEQAEAREVVALVLDVADRIERGDA